MVVAPYCKKEDKTMMIRQINKSKEAKAFVAVAFMDIFQKEKKSEIIYA